MSDRHSIVIALNERMWERVGSRDSLEKLSAAFDYRVEMFDLASGWTAPPSPDAEAESRLVLAGKGADALVVSHGAPRITGEILDQLPNIGFVGELEGDRFAYRIDVDACYKRGVRVVDTNNFCSPPVAEWALALILMGLRNYGQVFRRIVLERQPAHPANWEEDWGSVNGELRGKTVGLIGLGHIARELLKLLAPFDATVYVYDPYVPRELAEICGVTLTSLDTVMSVSDVVVNLVPLTPATDGMVGRREIDLLRRGAVFVNVGRGRTVDTAALTDRVRTGEVIACLDVTEPEPLPPASELIDLPTTILSPHIAGLVSAGHPRSLALMVDELTRHFAGHEPWFSILPRTVANRQGARLDASGVGT